MSVPGGAGTERGGAHAAVAIGVGVVANGVAAHVSSAGDSCGVCTWCSGAHVPGGGGGGDLRPGGWTAWSARTCIDKKTCEA